MTVEHTILVGLDGSPHSWQALGWAAEEADRTGRDLRVVQVGTARENVLSEATTRLAQWHPTVRATTTLIDGEPGARLAELSGTTDLLVLGRGRHGCTRLLHESVTTRMLMHAHCPTVVVASEFRQTPNRIVVGVRDSASGRAALHFAVAEAERRAAEVVAVHTWSARDRWLAADAAVQATAVELWEAEERTRLENLVDPSSDAFPDVKITTVLSTVPLEDVLERESRDAVMLVLGSRRSDDARPPRLGPVAAWAAHQQSCPVVIVGHPARRPAALRT